ncbi:hypothetical protein LINGRAHAP2_LOCUS10456 [Linum grandiflorum]
MYCYLSSTVLGSASMGK